MFCYDALFVAMMSLPCGPSALQSIALYRHSRHSQYAGAVVLDGVWQRLHTEWENVRLELSGGQVSRRRKGGAGEGRGTGGTSEKCAWDRRHRIGGGRVGGRNGEAEDC